MPYVHLANGDVKELTQDEMVEAFGDGTPMAFRDGGKEYAVIGVYPDAVEVEETPAPTESAPTENASAETESTHLGRKK